MKKHKNKGFTLVELLVVIAILAVLATVSILGYTQFTRKANIANDEAIVSQMNLALQANEALDNRAQYPNQAVNQCIEAGFILENLTPGTSSYDFGYDVNTNRFLLLECEDKKAEKPVYQVRFSDGQNYNEENLKENLFIVVGDQKELEVANKAGHSTYLREDFENNAKDVEIVTNKGIDVGESSNIKKVLYKNVDETNKENTKEQEVFIRTNSLNTELVVNAPKDVIYHYDVVGALNIIESANASYHEYGIVPFAEISKGRIALEKGAEVKKLHFNTMTKSIENDEVTKKADDEFDIIIVAAAEGVTLPEFSRDVVKIGTEGTLVVELQKDTNNNENTDSDYIWLFKSGVISQIVVVDEVSDKIVAEKQSDESYKFFAKKADDTVVQEVVLGVTKEEKPTQKAAVEIANNYKGSHGTSQTIGGIENVNVANVDPKTGELVDTNPENVEESGLSKTEKEVIKVKVIAEAIEIEEAKKAACIMNDIGYSTFDEAIEFMFKDGNKNATLTFNKNYLIRFKTESYITVPDGYSLTIDMNGYKVDVLAERENARSQFIKNNGALIIKDSSKEETGVISLLATDPDDQTIPGYASNIISNYGTMNMYSGTLKNYTHSEKGNACYPVDAYAGTTNIYGGKLFASGAALRLAPFNSSESTVNIDGGYLNGAVGLQLQSQSSGAIARLNISGGELTSGAGASLDVWNMNGNPGFNKVFIEISGGKFPKGVNLSKQQDTKNAETEYGKLLISGGEFGSLNSDSSLDDKFITGGTYGNNVGSYIDTSKYITVKSNDIYKIVAVDDATPEEKEAFNSNFECFIGNVGYYSLDSAINSAKNNDTIRLNADVTISNYFGYSFTKALTIDLYGHTITGSGNYLFFPSKDLILTSTKKSSDGGIEYGNIICKSGQYALSNNTGKLLLSNINFTTNDYYGIMSYGNDIEIISGYYNSTVGYLLYNYTNNIIIKGGTFDFTFDFVGSYYDASNYPTDKSYNVYTREQLENWKYVVGDVESNGYLLHYVYNNEGDFNKCIVSGCHSIYDINTDCFTVVSD